MSTEQDAKRRAEFARQIRETPLDFSKVRVPVDDHQLIADLLSSAKFLREVGGEQELELAAAFEKFARKFQEEIGEVR